MPVSQLPYHIHEKGNIQIHSELEFKDSNLHQAVFSQGELAGQGLSDAPNSSMQRGFWFGLSPATPPALISTTYFSFFREECFGSSSCGGRDRGGG